MSFVRYIIIDVPKLCLKASSLQLNFSYLMRVISLTANLPQVLNTLGLSSKTPSGVLFASSVRRSRHVGHYDRTRSSSGFISFINIWIYSLFYITDLTLSCNLWALLSWVSPRSKMQQSKWKKLPGKGKNTCREKFSQMIFCVILNGSILNRSATKLKDFNSIFIFLKYFLHKKWC